MNSSLNKDKTPPLGVTPISREGIRGPLGIILAVLLIISALMLPLIVTALAGLSPLPPMLTEGLSLAALLLIILYFTYTAKASGKPSRGMTPLILFFTLITFYMTGSLTLPALAVSFVFCIGEGAVLYATAGSRQLPIALLIPAFSFGIAWLLFGEAHLALLTLLPFPAALTLALGTRSSAQSTTGLTRVGVICATSLALSLTLTALALWLTYLSLGSLELSVLSQKIAEFRESLTQILTNISITYGDKVLKPLEGKEAEVANIVNGMINTMPGTLVALINILVAISQMITLSGLHVYGFGKSVTGRVRDFRISAVSAFVFLASWIVALVAVGENGASTIAGTVAENIITILTPGLALAGILRLVRYMAKRGIRPGCFIILLAPLLGLVAYLPGILALSEALILVFSPLRAKIKPAAPEKKDPPPPSREKSSRPLTDEERFEQYCRERQQQDSNNNEKQDNDS
ncbi:MAG: hypothetical protein E7645_03650 [Ruminococcaceae bacterium]|nr:hypothetical protein [Oscillospiraceae bacterium]